MHPAYSVIFFTTASGAGYGLLALFGIAAAIGWIDPSRLLGGSGLLLALGLITAGLFSSTLHLGHPERAWRAFSQWRSSWLSREGVAAVVTYAPALIFAYGWVWLGSFGAPWAAFGILAALCAVVTVYCTSMIYVSLNAVPRWNNRWVPVNYLTLALATGAVWFDVLVRVFNATAEGTGVLVVVTAALAATLKFLYWRDIDTADATATAESATGLGDLGKVRLLDPPHTSENYLLQEMGYRIARKHAQKLRRLSAILLFALPAVLAVAAMPLDEIPAAVLAIIGAISASVGVVIERWLFFAEAQHAVSLYYGAEKV